MPQNRQLAAIMFTDIVGYTAIMNQDEELAFQILEKNRVLHKNSIKEFEGRFLKELGDGVLASFKTASEAVLCAKAIQEKCQNAAAYSLTIGIHLGEVVFEETDVFGDGVNIASRIESITPADSIYISESVFQNVLNKKGIDTSFVGEKVLKNVKHAVRLYEVKIDGQADLVKEKSRKGLQGEEKSIAVLPFVNMSNDPEQDYFCDGLSEELLNVLAQLNKLKVAARTSSFIFKGQNQDISEIGKKLKVNTILEGSVRKSGNRIRITAQLINIEDGFHLWSARYDRELTDIFEIQDEIALAILKELKIKLLGKEKVSVFHHETENAEAYEYFLKGRHNFQNFSAEGYLTAIQYFDKALEVEPNYAKAHALKASAYLNLWHFAILPPHECYQQMHDSTLKAMELNDQIAESRYAMARYYLWHDFDLEKAEKEFEETLKINPNIQEALAHYGFVSNFLGKHEKAIELVRKAKALDPFAPMAGLDLIANLWVAGQYEMMFDEAKKILSLHPDFWGAHWYLAMYAWQNNDFKEALLKLEKMVECFEGQVSLSLLGCMSGVMGEKEKAIEIIEELNELSKEMHIGGFSYAVIYAGLGEMDKTFEYLELAGKERTGLLIFLDYFAHTIIPSLIKDKRFIPFLEKIGIPRYKQ